MLITRFISENPSTDNIMMFDWADCADICLHQPLRFLITGGNKLVNVALYAHLLYTIRLFDCSSTWYGNIHIKLHAASYSCCFWSHRWFLNVHPGSYVCWLYWQHRGVMTGVCVPAVCRCVMYPTRCPSFGSSLIWSPLDELYVYPWFGGVE